MEQDSTLAGDRETKEAEENQEDKEDVSASSLIPVRLTSFASRPVSLTPSYTPSPPPIWYLGIDFGKTGICATLLHRSEGKVYPIAWSQSGQIDSTEPIYRLPAVVSGGTVQKNFKPYLKVGIPYFSTDGKWEPELQWSPQENKMQLSHSASKGEVRGVALREVIIAVQKLLGNLKPKDRSGDEEIEKSQELESVSSFADGLSPETFASALANLGGVIISCPVNWPEAYRFNLRESVLAAHLVNSPEQICFLEESIATLLAELHLNSAVSEESKKLNPSVIPNSKPTWQGATLAIHSGATCTELVLVGIPKNLQDLTYSDFTLRSFPYAGSYIDQDIVCQLMLNPEIGSSLLNGLDLPLPGEPDLPTRYKLQIKLESTPLGQSLLEAAHHLKVILQHQESFTLNIGKYQWELQRQALENRVYSRFIQSLNRELNTLLALQGMSVEAIGQVLCTGGTAMLLGVSDWLRQKLPNAKIIVESGETIQSSQSKIERVALGLAVLPLYPQVFDGSRQQYNDYFLLLELLRTFGEQPLSAGKIMHILERKGINTRVCQQRLFALLEGDLPPGLVASELEATLLTQEDRQNPEYQALRAEKPFYKQEDQTYRLNSKYGDRLRRYLAMVLERTHQKLEDPYTVYWLAPASNANT